MALSIVVVLANPHPVVSGHVLVLQIKTELY